MAEPASASPSILVAYPNRGAFGAAEGDPAFAVVYVRPETNNVIYERAIVAGIRESGSVVYAANLGGALFARDRILEDHYAPQFRFAVDPCGEMARYPDMVSVFERHFHVSFDRSELIGAFDAIKFLGLGEDALFDTIVSEADFLDCWGQEFKRISGFIVANPNLPAVIRRYVPSANVFAAVVRSRGPATPEFFAGLNRAIYSQIVSRKETPVLDGEKLGPMVWSEKIRRTYHVSTNHLMAMLDMADFVYLDGGSRLRVTETPLGKRLLSVGAVDKERLEELARDRLTFIGPVGKRALAYLPTFAAGKGVGETCALLMGA